MLDEILDPFKRTDFIQHFIKEEKIMLDRVLFQNFHTTFFCIQHQKHVLDSFKVVYHASFNFQHHFLKNW